MHNVGWILLKYSYLLSFLLPDFKKKLKWKSCHGFSKAEWCLSAEFPVPGGEVSPDSGPTGHTLAFTQGRGVLGKGEKSWEKKLGGYFPRSSIHSAFILDTFLFQFPFQVQPPLRSSSSFCLPTPNSVPRLKPYSSFWPLSRSSSWLSQCSLSLCSRANFSGLHFCLSILNLIFRTSAFQKLRSILLPDQIRSNRAVS